MNEELEVCPFCGKESEIYVQPKVPHGWWYTPRCKDTSCCGRLTKKFKTKQEAISKWNIRFVKEK